jgi:prepilin-type N-terminal cleavage/methylation domain-containing protein
MRSQKGFSLLENLIAMAVLGIIGVTLLSGLALAARSNIIANEITTAETIAKSQMDYVKNLPYNNSASPGYTPDTDKIPSGYTVDISVSELEKFLQQITVTVSRSGKTVTTLTDYKVNR